MAELILAVGDYYALALENLRRTHVEGGIVPARAFDARRHSLVVIRHPSQRAFFDVRNVMARLEIAADVTHDGQERSAFAARN